MPADALKHNSFWNLLLRDGADRDFPVYISCKYCCVYFPVSIAETTVVV